MNEHKKFSINNMMLAFITVIVVIGLVALAGFFLLTPPEEVIMGQAEATEIRISGKVPGRIRVFAPVGGFADSTPIEDGYVRLPSVPGIGFEEKSKLMDLFRAEFG